ncbi:MAG TPA: hypothetical protein VFH51_17860 [Myxococcota bacterium]|nr:hypothetical protein [Myxococcota bacterium]
MVHPSRAALALALTVLASCVPRVRAVITGHALDEDGRPVPNLRVRLEDTGQATSTDRTGRFEIRYLGPLPATEHLSLVGEAHARWVRPLRIEGHTRLEVTLRQHGTLTAITLPTGQAPPVEVTVRTALGSATLRIPSESLVSPDGRLASGQAVVSLTAWHPPEATGTAPGPLLGAVDGDTSAPKRLDAHAMVDIEVKQNGHSLQVAPGKALEWVSTVPAGLTADGAALWSLDETRAVWVRQESNAGGALHVDPSARTLTGKVPHLGAWNVATLP